MSEEYNEGILSAENEPTAPEVERTEAPMNVGYDSEWVRFLSQLSDDASLVTIVKYIESVDLTKRAKEKLKVYITTLLDREFAVSRLENREDFMRLLDKKNILDADFCLGLTRFDISPELTHVRDLIDLKWDIKIRRSLGGGFERKILATTRSENVSEERVKNVGAPKKGVGDKVRGIFE